MNNTSPIMDGKVAQNTSDVTYLPPLQSVPHLAHFMITCLVIMTVVGVIGNVLVMLSFVVDKKLRQPGNLFIINLAITDIGVSGLYNPFYIVGVMYGRQYFDPRPVMCDLLGTLVVLTCLCSTVTMAAIAFNRFILMVHSPLYPKIFSYKKTFVYCIALWIIAFLIEMPAHTGWTRNAFDEKTLGCVYDRTMNHSYTIFMCTTCMVIPVAMIAYFNIRIYLHVKKARTAAHRDGRSDSKEQKEQRKNVQLAKTLFIIFVGFAICWGPYAFFCLVDSEDELPIELYGLLGIMALSSSSGLNFAIYGVTNAQFRAAYVKILTCGKVGVLSCEYTRTHVHSFPVVSRGPDCVAASSSQEETPVKQWRSRVGRSLSRLLTLLTVKRLQTRTRLERQ